jgi:hypothetical protein
MRLLYKLTGACLHSHKLIKKRALQVNWLGP